MKRSTSTHAIVLKRVNTGESDRIITLFTEEQGKVTCVAKGVRKMNSSQRAYLEPGNLVSVLLIHTKSLPLLTQTRLVNDFPQTKTALKSLKKLTEVLEIIDQLFAEEMEEEGMFELVRSILEKLNLPQPPHTQIQNQLSEMLVRLGYQPLHETKYSSVLDYVSSVAERPLRSYDYLTVKK